MPLSCEALSDKLWDGHRKVTDRDLCIVPIMSRDAHDKNKAASIDLRLGRWFRTMRQTKLTVIRVGDDKKEESITKEHYVRFNDVFVLHPGEFVIGITLEWLKLPSDLAGYVTGKSSWGRRGLIIETAAGIHPGFTGCLTLEFANVGATPIELTPGIQICQVFFHNVGRSEGAAVTQFVGYRKPVLGKISKDQVAKALSTDFF